MAESASANLEANPVQQQAQEQSGQRQITLRVNEQDMKTSYANAFRTNGTAEEVMLDFGLNLMGQPQNTQGQAEIVFQVNQRVILNYYTAKRLAITLSQLIRQHEQQFCELELDVNKRQGK